MSSRCSIKGYASADLKFHLTVLFATHNDFYRALATGVRTALVVYLRMTGEDAMSFEQGRPLHLGVLEAIRAGQAARAGSAMEGLLDGSLEVIGRLKTTRQGEARDEKGG